MNGRQIADEIRYWVAVSVRGYADWTIGITNDPERRSGEHQSEGDNVRRWRQWQADSKVVAQEVEAFFKKMGMKGDLGGGNEDSVFVYIF
ncbi:MAG: hypothetical protein HY247_07325 [archaeon]|nr:MAG: hypothetical protein HY247_07325 [archaeon]